VCKRNWTYGLWSKIPKNIVTVNLLIIIYCDFIVCTMQRVIIVIVGMRKVRDYVPEMRDNQERKPWNPLNVLKNWCCSYKFALNKLPEVKQSNGVYSKKHSSRSSNQFYSTVCASSPSTTPLQTYYRHPLTLF